MSNECAASRTVEESVLGRFWCRDVSLCPRFCLLLPFLFFLLIIVVAAALLVFLCCDDNEAVN